MKHYPRPNNKCAKMIDGFELPPSVPTACRQGGTLRHQQQQNAWRLFRSCCLLVRWVRTVYHYTSYFLTSFKKKFHVMEARRSVLVSRVGLREWIQNIFSCNLDLESFWAVWRARGPVLGFIKPKNITKLV